MLSVEASSGSTSTNQTATFGYSMSDTAEDAQAAPARGTSIKNEPEGHGTPTPRDRHSPGSTRRPRSPVVSGAVREVSTSSRHATPSPRRKASVIRKSKSSPEAAMQDPERSNSKLIRRKGLSTNVDETDDLDMSAAASMGNAGMVTCYHG